MRIRKKPVLCNYYVTYRCNAKCGFCDIFERPSPFITLLDVEQNLKDLKKLGVRVIDFTGGEPLLHPEIADFNALAQKLGFITTITTNTLKYPKFAEALKGKVDMLHFSLDAPNAFEHNTIRGVDCFDSVLNSISIARKIGERPDILFTVSDQNIHHIEEMLHTICIPNGLILILNPIFAYNDVDTFQGLRQESLEVLLKWSKHPSIYLNKAFIKLRMNGGNQREDPICKAASSTLVISPDNTLILPCYHLGKKTFPIQSNLFQLYQSKEVQTLVHEEGRLPECQGCVINCYMQPSFAVEMNKYWWYALGSTLKYSLKKGTYKRLWS